MELARELGFDFFVADAITGEGMEELCEEVWP